MAAGKLVDARQTFRAAMIVAAYAYVPRILDSVLLGLQGLFPISAARRAVPAVVWRGTIPRSDTVSPLLLAIVGRVDVIDLDAVLIAIGLCMTGRIPLRKAAIAAVVIVVRGWAADDYQGASRDVGRFLSLKPVKIRQATLILPP